jgi:hypothetical protein
MCGSIYNSQEHGVERKMRQTTDGRLRPIRKLGVCNGSAVDRILMPN